MAIQVLVDRRPDTQLNAVYVYEVQTDPLQRRVMDSAGGWREVGPPGTQATPTFVLPDECVVDVVRALGVPLSDAHLLEALRHERNRVDLVLGKLTDGVLRGL